MNIKDIGVIIAKKPLKESTFIITVFTQNHGLYSGVVKGNAKKDSYAYQEGNVVDFFWQARLHEHIGMAKCELIRSYNAALISSKIKLYAFNSVIFLIKSSFSERESHNNFFAILEQYLGKLAKDFCFKEYINFELALLEEAGYKLELSHCVVTRSSENLGYVSPKSGKAVSRPVGLPYQDKLLVLPEFLTNTSDHGDATDTQKKQAFTLTDYFFNRYILPNDQKVHPRTLFIEYILSL